MDFWKIVKSLNDSPTPRTSLTTYSHLPPPTPKVLPQEWRNGPWGKKAVDLKFVEDYKPFKDNVQLRFMLYGPVGAGKSSFINSVESALRGEITDRAKTDAIGGKSYTTKYKAYKIKKGDTGTHYPFVFNDVMGLEKDEGVCVEDIKLAIKGHVKNGYNFNPRSSLSEDNQHYNRDPSLNDRVHVLVCIIPGSIAGLQDDSVRKLREVRLAARDMDIPEIAILTKIDEACPEVGKDIRNVYKSKHLKKKIEEVSGRMGFPQNCIFPVKNYHSDIDTNDDTDTLILSALRRMIESGEDFVNDL
ncbi:interferon-induced protein 44-like isoform X2 [Gymnodraco acuticeps]|uniref:Interferon-induced protein 44-like isoform X2 n=1 Tax=Gymnodraco acuticeps TaxID=8218 RepID=A0A6P8WBB5_GYMAC|nr:interferon-induced protein 44-like isoform X2 [Gymnodraco acuticeps]